MLFDTMPKAWEPAKDVMKVQIGDPEDKELMSRMSPLDHVDKIKAPLMIVHGARDPRVVDDHALELREKLEARGITLSDDEWIMKRDEGHGFRKILHIFFGRVRWIQMPGIGLVTGETDASQRGPQLRGIDGHVEREAFE